MKSLVILVVVLGLFAGCGDDDTTGPTVEPSAWTTVALPDSFAGHVLWRVDADAGRGLGLLLNPSLESTIAEIDAEGVTRVERPLWPSGTVVFDVEVASTGRGVAVGGSLGGAVFVATDGPEWTATSLVAGSGILLDVVERADGSLVAVGSSAASPVRVDGSIDGEWTRSTVALPGNPNDRSLVAVTEGADGLYACGFNDGGEGTPENPFRLVMRDTGSGFELMPGPCTDCTSHEYEAMASTSSGGVLLGGAITNFRIDAADDYRAFLALWSPTSEDWVEIVLPDAGALDKVNAILVASDGSVYLACGMEGSATVVRQPPDGPAVVDWVADGPADVLDLAELDDGTILAGGRRGGAQFEPLLLLRSAER